jgi:hypothetical protein
MKIKIARDFNQQPIFSRRRIRNRTIKSILSGDKSANVYLFIFNFSSTLISVKVKIKIFDDSQTNFEEDAIVYFVFSFPLLAKIVIDIQKRLRKLLGFPILYIVSKQCKKGSILERKTLACCPFCILINISTWYFYSLTKIHVPILLNVYSSYVLYHLRTCITSYEFYEFSYLSLNA